MHKRGIESEAIGEDMLSRRTFVTGLGLGALGLAVATAQGCSTGTSAPANDSAKDKVEEDDKAQEDAAEQPKDETVNEAPAKSGASETVDVDVCVVGSGPSGITAAITAADAGSSVLVIESLPQLGVCGHSMTAVQTSWQNDLGITMTPQDLVDFWATYESPLQNRELMLTIASESPATVEWMTQHGVEFVGVTAPPTNPFQDPLCTLVTKGGRDGKASYLDPLKATADAAGVEFRFGCTADVLIQNESGAIVGVTATTDTGATLTVNAKSTILCAGGFGSNTDIVRTYAPRTPNVGPVQGIANGFSIIAGKNVGAQLAMPGGTQAMFNSAAGPDYAGQGLYFDISGKRFINENLYVFDRSGMALEQGIAQYWAIFDSEAIEAVYNMPKDNILKAADEGTIIVADSVEGIASRLGVNAEVLKQTVETYNGYCASGVDEEFGKPATRVGRVMDPNRANEYDPDLIEREFKLLNPVATPPFYVLPMVANSTYLTGTQGGVMINDRAEVIGTNDQPVPGLFAAGESANGQVFGFIYPQSGASLCMCFTTGRFAGASAAEYAAA